MAGPALNELYRSFIGDGSNSHYERDQAVKIAAIKYVAELMRETGERGSEQAADEIDLLIASVGPVDHP